MSSAAGILLVWFFLFMTGATPSAVRAGVMQTILMMAPIFRRENDGPMSLMAVLALILLVNPFMDSVQSFQEQTGLLQPEKQEAKAAQKGRLGFLFAIK